MIYKKLKFFCIFLSCLLLIILLDNSGFNFLNKSRQSLQKALANSSYLPSNYSGLSLSREPLLEANLSESTMHDFRAQVPSEDNLLQPFGDLFERGRQSYRDGNYPEAIQLWEQALETYEQLGNRSYQSLTSTNLAFALVNMKKSDMEGRDDSCSSALNYAQQGLILAREIGDRNLESLALHARGYAYKCLGNDEQGTADDQQSLAIARELGNPEREAQVATTLAENVEEYLKSLHIAEENGDLREQARVWFYLGVFYTNQGK